MLKGQISKLGAAGIDPGNLKLAVPGPLASSELPGSEGNTVHGFFSGRLAIGPIEDLRVTQGLERAS